MQRGQSTHARGRNTLNESVSRTLSALGTKAGKEPGHRFRGLARLLDRQMLGEAFRRLKRKAAPGIDGVTHGEYAKNLEENLLALESRLKEGKYRALPVKRRWIAKAGSSKMRPLGIPVLEDKIVQQAVRMILEPILRGKLQGDWNYYGVIGNSEQTGPSRIARGGWFTNGSTAAASAEASRTSFKDAWERWKIPPPRVIEKPWPKTLDKTSRTHDMKSIQPTESQS